MKALSGRAKPLRPQNVVASFDSASVLHAGLVAALNGKPFPHLGNPAAVAAAVRVAGRLPWPILRHLYTRVGAGEADVAAWLADGIPDRRYPAALIGSSNGALTHLAAAMQIPWLPTTVLVPVSRVGDPHIPDAALRFGQRHAPALLDANPGVVLHHMHDQVQDQLMVARMTYFRVKWRVLPAAYRRFLSRSLAPGAPVIVVEDASRWPVVQVGERHVFQIGAQGGLAPQAYLSRPNTPDVDAEAPEAEWGADAALGCKLARWCAEHGHPLVRIAYTGPQAPAHAVATLLRSWYTGRGEDGDRLLVPQFVLGDPWRNDQFRVDPVLDVLLRAGRPAEPGRPPGRKPPLPPRRRAAVPARRGLRGDRHPRRLGPHRPQARRHRRVSRPGPATVPPRHRHARPLRTGDGRVARRSPTVDSLHPLDALSGLADAGLPVATQVISETAAQNED